jgi:hypothetical protein
MDERTWRTGVVADPAPWQAAARAGGSVTAWRSFTDAERYLWIQCAPLASATDAAAALAAASSPSAGLRNNQAQVGVISRRDVDPLPVVRGASQVTATEETTTGPGLVHTLRCTTGLHVVVLCASGPGWDWPAVAALADAQLNRLPAD